MPGALVSRLNRAAPARARAARTPAGRASRRGRRADAPCPPAPRARPRGCRPARRPPRATARAPCAGARTPMRTSAASSSDGAGAVRRMPHERGVDVRHRPEHVARDRPHDFDLAGELDQHGGDAVCLRARLCRKPVRDLALHHHAPERRVRQLVDRLQDRGGRDAVGQVRDHLVRERVEPAEPRAHHVGDHEVVEFSWPASASRSTGSSFASVSITCRWRTRWREVGAQHAEPAADLEHHVVGVELRGAADRPRGCCRRSGSSDPTRGSAGCRAARGGRGSRGSRSPVEQTGGVGVEQPFHLLEEIPRSSARKRAVAVTYAGSLGLPRRSCGERNGASVSASSSSSGIAAAASLEVGGLRIGDVARERAVPAPLDALLDPVGEREAVDDHRARRRRGGRAGRACRRPPRACAPPAAVRARAPARSGPRRSARWSSRGA